MKQDNPLERKLVLVDLENVCGKSKLSVEDAEQAKEDFFSRHQRGNNDLVVIGTSHPNNMLAAKAGWGEGRCVMQNDHNGGDLAIIEAARSHFDNIATFSEVVLSSGDGIFTSLVRDITRKGVRVTVASRIGSLNANLAKSASCLSFLDCRA